MEVSVRTARTVIITALVACGATAAGAQTSEKNELSVFGGISLIDAETNTHRNPYILAQPAVGTLVFPPIFGTSSRFDGSGEFGVRYGREVTETLSLIGDFSVAPAHESTDQVSYGCPALRFCIADTAIFAPDFQVSERVVAYHYGGGLQWKVWPAPVRPSVIAGIGGVTYSGQGHSETQLAMRVGGSVGAAVGKLTTALEILDVIVADHYLTTRTEHDVHVRIALGVRW
jgi:hypothetical protein